MNVIVVALLALGATYAVGTILLTCRHYRGAVSALRQMLTDCPDEKTIQCVICEWTVFETADVLRPDFSRSRAVQQSDRGLRAAA